MLSTKNKILVLNTSSKISGAERSLVDVLEVISTIYTPILIIPSKGEFYKCLEGKVIIEIVKLIRLKRKNSFKEQICNCLKIVKHIFKLNQIIKRYKINIIYANNNSALIYAVLLKIFTGKVIVCHVRDNLNNKILILMYGIFCDKIFCTSEHIKKQIPFKGKVELIFNGIDTSIWKPTFQYSNKIKDELGINHKSILIAHIGQLIPWKRHGLFIEVAKKIIQTSEYDIHFVIIGDDMFDDYPDYTYSLKEKVKVLNIQSKFSFLNFKNNFIEYLNGIDILVHLAYNEPFGRVVIEAMALEKPVITVLDGGPSEIVSNGKSGYLVKYPSAANIAHKIKTIISNPQKRTQFGKAGREIVEKKFSISNLQKIRSILSLMNEKNPN